MRSTTENGHNGTDDEGHADDVGTRVGASHDEGGEHGRRDGFGAADEAGAHGSDAVDAPQVGGEGDGGAQHDGDCHGKDDVGRPCDRVAPDSPDEADPGSGDGQAVADDEFGTVCGDEAGG